MTDEFDQLTQEAIAGDREAFDSLLLRYLPELRAFVRLRAGGIALRKDRESDLVQSVCREVLTHADQLQHANEGAFKRWLFTTALRKILNRREHNLAQRRNVLREEGFDTPDGQDRALVDVYRRFTRASAKVTLQEDIERIEKAMATLSEEQREVVSLAHIVGMSRLEIAEAIGKSEGAVRTILYRAMAQMAVSMGE